MPFSHTFLGFRVPDHRGKQDVRSGVARVSVFQGKAARLHLGIAEGRRHQRVALEKLRGWRNALGAPPLQEHHDLAEYGQCI